MPNNEAMEQLNENNLNSKIKTGFSRFEIADRRMRQVYNLLEMGSNKKAVQEIDKMLRKIKPIPFSLMSLRCLALFRANRIMEARENANSLLEHDQLLDNESFLKPLIQYFKESGQLNAVVFLYKKVCTLQPNEDNMKKLFYAYSLTNQHSEQKQVAYDLLHLSKNKQYRKWVLICLFQEIRTNPNQLLLLKLAMKLSEIIQDMYFRLKLFEITSDYKSILQLTADNDFLDFRIPAMIECSNDSTSLLIVIHDEYKWLSNHWTYFKKCLDRIITEGAVDIANLVDWLEILKKPFSDYCTYLEWTKMHNCTKDLLTDMIDSVLLSRRCPIIQNQDKLVKLLKHPLVPVVHSKNVHLEDTASLAIIYCYVQCNRFEEAYRELMLYLNHYGQYRSCRFDVIEMLGQCKNYNALNYVGMCLLKEILQSFDWKKFQAKTDTRMETFLLNSLSIVSFLCNPLEIINHDQKCDFEFCFEISSDSRDLLGFDGFAHLTKTNSGYFLFTYDFKN